MIVCAQKFLYVINKIWTLDIPFIIFIISSKMNKNQDSTSSVFVAGVGGSSPIRVFHLVRLNLGPIHMIHRVIHFHVNLRSHEPFVTFIRVLGRHTISIFVLFFDSRGCMMMRRIHCSHLLFLFSCISFKDSAIFFDFLFFLNEFFIFLSDDTTENL